MVVELVAAETNSFLSTWNKNTANTSFRDGSLFPGKESEGSGSKSRSLDCRVCAIALHIYDQRGAANGIRQTAFVAALLIVLLRL